MIRGLDKIKLIQIYDRVARHYDYQHAFLTARSDQKGRRVVVAKTVHPKNTVLDIGAGTGSTGLLAAEKVGPKGRVVLLDQSSVMLDVAREKAASMGLTDRTHFLRGDIMRLPFRDGLFDVVLSTYSVCPLANPAAGALEAFRVLKPGGWLAFAHSTEPANPLIRRIARWVEAAVWRLPSISLGCRPVSVLPALEMAGAELVFSKIIGVPLWPFLVIVVRKPL